MSSSSTEFNARKIWDIARYDCAGRELDPENRRGPEVHPDMMRFDDWFYVIFNVPGGKQIIRSPDAVTWECVQQGRVGQMFAITPWDDLMTVGTGPMLEKKPDGKPYRQSFTKFTSDGVAWSLDYAPPALLDTVLYHVVWHEGMAYGVGYSGKDDNGTLYRSENARDWQPIKQNLFPAGRHGNEGALAFEDDGTAYCLLRGSFETPVTMGFSRGPDYQQWRWDVPEVDWYGDGKTLSADEAIRAPFGGPKLLRLSDGRLIAYGRVLGPEAGQEKKPLPEDWTPAGGDKGDPHHRDEHATVTLLEFDPQRNRLTRLMSFPGFTHYHGIVEHDRRLWVACGSCDSAWEVWLLDTPVPA